VNGCKPLMRGHTSYVNDARFTVDGSRVLSAGTYTRTLSAQRKRLLWDRGCTQGVLRWYLGGFRGY